MNIIRCVVIFLCFDIEKFSKDSMQVPV